MWNFIHGMWNFVLGLEREMTLGESFYLSLLLSMLLLWMTGFVCEPYANKTVTSEASLALLSIEVSTMHGEATEPEAV